MSVAASDSCGGAGIQADIKTFSAFGVYAMTAVTAVTAQNTLGVQAVFPVAPEAVAAQIDSVCVDIRPGAVKIGVVPDGRCVAVIAEKIRRYALKNIVVNTVFSSTSGAVFQTEETVGKARAELYPLADVIIPNIPEAEFLCGLKIRAAGDCMAAAEKIAGLFGRPVLITGGHLPCGAGLADDSADDFLFDLHRHYTFSAKRERNPHTHGTGCTLSSAIAACLAKGLGLEDAVRLAKRFLSGAIADNMELGHGRGPLNHLYITYPENKGD